MLAISKRLEAQHFFCFPAYGTIEPAYQRVKQLIDTGRPLIYVERWMDGGDLTLSPGLGIYPHGISPGLHFERHDDFESFRVVLDPGVHTVGMHGYQSDGPESAVAERFHAKKDGTRIDIEGFGRGRNDHVLITNWNEHGVGRQVGLWFQYEEVDKRAAREAAFLEMLAEQGDWSGDRLKVLAARVREQWEPTAELAKES